MIEPEHMSRLVHDFQYSMVFINFVTFTWTAFHILISVIFYLRREYIHISLIEGLIGVFSITLNAKFLGQIYATLKKLAYTVKLLKAVARLFLGLYWKFNHRWKALFIRYTLRCKIIYNVIKEIRLSATLAKNGSKTLYAKPLKYTLVDSKYSCLPIASATPPRTL